MLRIEISPLKPGLHHVELEPEAAALDLDPEKFREIRVDAHLDVHEKRILVILQVGATAQLVCDRTLVLFDQEIEGQYSVLFAHPEFAHEDEARYDEVRVFYPGDPSIDLTDVTRDTLLLAVPSRCLAPGAEEADIDTVFGAPEGDQEPIDPRWEALRRLRGDD